ncbi:DUF2339 domain-containing protein [Paracidobacterium acidisoli]|uniref:DUF2339 domain-containing protein n=1 Tax=Paracidobacterium acidisoli TaxID=2303751 RepID=A0A372IQC5_9BACT|nr:DUF2339 domain-containing protein [Paracidobacterium acidisoli]MBT9331440.1 DUF2339 domain-containing protein [Paracidobacterium acidisoli]
MNSESKDAFEPQIAELRARVQRLERALQARGIVLEAPSPSLQPPSASDAAEAAPSLSEVAPQSIQTQSATSPAATPSAFQSVEPAPKDDRSLEARIGSQLFNRIGILAVLIGMAWFLKLAIDNHWIGPAGRVIIGLIAGAGLIAWSERFRSKGYRAFSYSLNAVGSGILYLSLWAAYSLFHLLPLPAVALAMLLVTASNGFLSWLRNSEVLAFYAAVGGYMTPLLLSNGRNHEASLFSWLLILNAAALLLAALRPWPRMAVCALLGTIAYAAGWYAVFYSDAQFAETLVFSVVFLLVFASVPWCVKEAPGHHHREVALFVASVNAAFGWAGIFLLFHRSGWPWAALALAALYFILSRIPSASSLVALHLLTANTFLLTAVTVAIHNYWHAAAMSPAQRMMDAQFSDSTWFLLFGAVLLAAGFRFRSAPLRWQALVLLCISIAKVFLVDMRMLSQGYRIFSFLGLGVLLLAVSFVYQRDWLGLRRHLQTPGNRP